MKSSAEQLSRNFDQSTYNETERKFIPLSNDSFDAYRPLSQPIEQYYLSHPNEPFSLRLRQYVKNGNVAYESTIKDRGSLQTDGLSRMEVTAQVTAELYDYYKSESAPVLRKLRADVLPGISIDYYEDGTVQVESENEDQLRQFMSSNRHPLIEITGQPLGDNEWRAYNEAAVADRAESIVKAAEFDLETAVWQTISKLHVDDAVTVHVGGRSGSGKSTVVNELAERLHQLGVATSILSTDDYHRGATWLSEYNNGQPWERWDDAVVYDTATMSRDIELLRSGQHIPKRTIDWITVEPRYEDAIAPAEVIIIEGIYATSPDITNKSDLIYELDTPLATCVGRRLLRDKKERPQFADLEKSLAYMLFQAEPAYRRQK